MLYIRRSVRLPSSLKEASESTKLLTLDVTAALIYKRGGFYSVGANRPSERIGGLRHTSVLSLGNNARECDEECDVESLHFLTPPRLDAGCA